MTSTEYIPNAMASRFDLISKALTTAVTGYLTRKSVLNMQALICNNFRMIQKNTKIVQFAYGEDYLDASRIESVTLPTILCSDAELAQYGHPDFPTDFAQIKTDRAELRKWLKQLEEQSRNSMMTGTINVPVNVERIIRDVTREYIDERKKPTSNELKILVQMVRKLCEDIPFVLTNSHCKKLPQYMHNATQLTVMLCRVLLNPNTLVEKQITIKVLNYIAEKIKFRYRQGLIEPGTAVGTLAAQCFSEPLTQYMLDAHHRSASGGTSTNVTSIANDILGVKKTEELALKQMLIPVMSDIENSSARVQEIANNIEVMKFERFVRSWNIFYEEFGKPVHSQYFNERVLINNFQNANQLLKPPSDLTRWCIRFELNKTTMILKNMSIELIILKLRLNYPDLYFVYTGENSEKIIIRAYVRNTIHKGAIKLNIVRNTKTYLLDTIIRGVSGITNANVIKFIRTKENPDGSISQNNDCYAIITEGVNLEGVLRLKYVDKNRLCSNSIHEMSEIFGVEAGRKRVIEGLKSLVETSNRHYLCYADEMSYAGVITNIEISGLRQRDSNNIMLRLGFGSSLGTIKESAINAMEDNISGLGALMVGSIPKHGTLYNSVIVNKQFIGENVKRPEDIIIDSLL